MAQHARILHDLGVSKRSSLQNPLPKGSGNKAVWILLFAWLWPHHMITQNCSTRFKQ